MKVMEMNDKELSSALHCLVNIIQLLKSKGLEKEAIDLEDIREKILMSVIDEEDKKDVD